MVHYTNYNCSYNYNYATWHYATLNYTTLHDPTLRYTTLITPPQMQLQLRYTNYTTPQLHLHYTTTTTTAALHHSTSSSCGWGDRPGDHCNHCNRSKKHNSNHLSVHQWIRSAIHASQQLISPIVPYLWNFCHRLVQYYWYLLINSWLRKTTSDQRTASNNSLARIF